MRMRIGFIDVIGIVRSYYFHLMFFSQLDQGVIHPIFILLTMSHQLYIEIFAKLFFPPNQGFLSLGFTNVQDLTRYLTIQVTRQNDQIFFIAFDSFFVDSWHIIESFSISHRSHFCHIVISLLVFRQEDNLITVVFTTFILSILTNIKFTSNYWLNDSTIIGLSIFFRSEEHTSELQSRENLVCRL